MCTYSQSLQEAARQKGYREGKEIGYSRTAARLPYICMVEKRTDLCEAMAFFCFPESKFEIYTRLTAEISEDPDLYRLEAGDSCGPNQALS